jgi:hypothetical protein
LDIILGCLSYGVLITISLLSLSDLDQINLSPSNCQNKYGILICLCYSRHFVQRVQGKADLLFKLAAFQRNESQHKKNGLHKDKFVSVYTKPLSM